MPQLVTNSIIFSRLTQILWTLCLIPLKWCIRLSTISPQLDLLFSRIHVGLLLTDSGRLRPNLTTCSRLSLFRPSKSPWASPLHFVRKSETDFRPVGDYRRLNSVTVPDRYSIPNIQDFSGNQYRCSIFLKIDLIRAYCQIPVKPVDIPKTAITTPFGNFEFLFMPFGLRNAPSTFQRLIDEVVRGLNFVFAYVDDLLVASNTEENHISHLSQHFERLTAYYVRTNADKCVFGQNSLDF